MTVRTRFAPSPTGPLHLGHAFSANLAHDFARARGGDFLLRIEDIDRQRAKPEWEALLLDDLAWLGLTWETPVMRQSDRMPAYADALDMLWRQGLIYPCDCTRRDIADALSAPQEGSAANTPVYGPDGPVYPGTCRGNMAFERTEPEAHPRPEGRTLRLDMAAAVRAVEGFGFHPDGDGGGQWLMGWDETGAGPDGQTGRVGVTPETLMDRVGDVVLARRDFGTSYHLSVVVDDAAQGITHVTRGQDLFEATAIHVLLQRLLDLPVPVYHHHRLIRDGTGRRLAKREDARAIRVYRDAGATPAEIRRMVGL